jgi:dTDP-4-amino-4,6-dideoxygalactose transaminase
MKIEMVDLRGQYQHIIEEIDQAILSIIRDAQFINGRKVSKFPNEL